MAPQGALRNFLVRFRKQGIDGRGRRAWFKQRHRFELSFNRLTQRLKWQCTSHVGPDGVHASDHIVRSLGDNAGRYARALREMLELFDRNLRKLARRAQSKSRLIMLQTDLGAQIIVGGSEFRRPPITVDKRPILEMHVVITDADIEDQPMNEVDQAIVAGCMNRSSRLRGRRSDYRTFVRILTINLIEVLDVNLRVRINFSRSRRDWLALSCSRL